MLYHSEPFADIKNFILIKYDKVEDDDLQSGVEFRYHRMVQERLFGFMIDQLRRMYPKSYLHIITDHNIQIDKMVIPHQLSIPHHFLNKFLIWDLLDEPAMYIDTDVVLHYPFLTHHLLTDNFFNLYYCYDQDLQKGSRVVFPRPVLKHYNNGIIWIDRPHKGFGNLLSDIHQKYFSDGDYLLSQEMMPHNDEHAVSFFVETEGLKMNLRPDVNHQGWNKNLSQVQSSHFPGRRLKKQLIEYLENLS